MANLERRHGRVRLRLSRWERVLALRGDVDVPDRPGTHPNCCRCWRRCAFLGLGQADPGPDRMRCAATRPTPPADTARTYAPGASPR